MFTWALTFLITFKLNRRVINFLNEKAYKSNEQHNFKEHIENLIKNDSNNGAKFVQTMTSQIIKHWEKWTRKLPKWSPSPPKIEPKWGLEGARAAQKSGNDIAPTKKWEG